MSQDLNFTNETIHDLVTYHISNKSRFEEAQNTLDKLGIKFCRLKIGEVEQPYVYLPTVGPFHLLIPYVDFYTYISEYEISYSGKNPVMYILPNGEIKPLQSLFPPEKEEPVEFNISISLTGNPRYKNSYQHSKNKLEWSLDISNEDSWKPLLHEAGHGWQDASKSTVNYNYGGIGNMIIGELRERYKDAEILQAIKE